MNNSVIIRIVIWSVVAVMLIGLLIIGLTRKDLLNINFNVGITNSYNYADSERYKAGASSVPAADIKAVEIYWISGRVTAERYDGDEIVFEEYSGNTLEESEKLRYLAENGKLIIQYREPYSIKFGIFQNIMGKDLTVKIPRSLDRLKLSTTSAEIDIENIPSSEIDINTVSGSVIISGSEGDKLNATTVSGEISAAVSYPEINCKSVSGNVELKSRICPDIVNVNTVSGETVLLLPENEGFTADVNTVSGDIDCSFSVKYQKKILIYKNGSAKFDFNSVSGDIKVYYNK